MEAAKKTARVQCRLRLKGGQQESSGGQSLAAFGPPAVDDCPACFGFHPDPKAMGAMTFGIARLESSLAHAFFLDSFSFRQPAPAFLPPPSAGVENGRRNDLHPILPRFSTAYSGNRDAKGCRSILRGHC
jgi:hypothetical protein